MKILNKKIPLVFALAFLFIFSAIVYSVGYKMAMNKFNNIVSYNNEKHKMYSLLSDVDYNIRNDFVGEIDENKLLEQICVGYANGVDSQNCKFFTNKDYEEYNKNQIYRKVSINDSKINDVGYIRIDNFCSTSSSIFKEKLNKLMSDGIKKLVIDVRNCEYGDYSEAMNVLKFLINDKEIVSAVNKKGEKDVICSSDIDLGVRVAVLVNEKTSGPAEVLASAFKDKEDSAVIGCKTKGSAVREKAVIISEDFVLVFPDAYYVTKSGNIILNSGVEPNEYIKLSAEKEKLFSDHALDFQNDELLMKAVNYFNN
ncbi:MAG: S41 family peptidase [Clostridia bacterium]|nr:S41 family peptidase [Clostridia bacterium]